MGGTPTSIPTTLSCLSIIAFVFLYASSTTALSHTHSPSRLLQTLSAHRLLIAASPPTSSITSSGLTSAGASDGNKQASRTHLSKKAMVGIVLATMVLGSILLCLLLLCLFQNHASNTQSSIKKSQTQADITAAQIKGAGQELSVHFEWQSREQKALAILHVQLNMLSWRLQQITSAPTTWWAVADLDVSIRLAWMMASLLLSSSWNNPKQQNTGSNETFRPKLS